MKYCEAKQGRAFERRLQDGDAMHESIELTVNIQAQPKPAAALVA